MNGVSATIFGQIMINLGATTFGNVIGGMALSLAYWTIAKKTL